MNDLISLQNKAIEAIKKFQDIKSFDDLELWLFQGRGQSRNTYETYLTAVKQFYNFYDGLHPLQWTPGHIERFYDHVREKHTVKTAYLRLAGIKKICENIRSEMPFWESPFDIMSDECRNKINKTEKGAQKEPMYQKELDEVFAYLEDGSLKNLQTTAVIRVIIDTAIRAAEVCGLTSDSLKHDLDTDTYYITGVGKGNKDFRESITPVTLDAIKRQFYARMGRTWKPGEFLFYSLESYNGKPPAKLTKATLWARLREIGDKLKADGKIRGDLEFSAHLFKRTSITLAGKYGVSISRLQKLGHHSSSKTTMDFYFNDTEDITDVKLKMQGVA